MSELRYTLVADGASDRALCPALDWILERHTRRTPLGEVPDLGRLPRPPRSLADRLAVAAKLAPCDLMFIHRDAERRPPEERRAEIAAAVRESGVGPHVPVIPVRMTEAWLVWAEEAIRGAAGNPRGRGRLELPRPADVERVSDPKESLSTALRTASESRGRKLEALRVTRLAQRVADRIGDYSPLLAAPAFARLDAEVAQLVAARRW
jgi:hypothetical protein